MITSKSLFRTALALGLVAMPLAAQAGTTTAVSNVAVELAAQCTVTGATVNLGSFLTSQTWDIVALSLGGRTTAAYTRGSRGFEYLNFGSVTCDNGAPYTLSIKGTMATGNAGSIRFSHNGKTIEMNIGIKKLGTVTLPDNSTYWPGTGQQVWATLGALNATGTGLPQDLIGNVTVNFASGGTTATQGEKLAVAGVMTDDLTYTLTF